MSAEASYPEHAKLRAVRDRSQIIGQFLEDLRARGVELCEMDQRDEFQPLGKTIQQILADYFEIDLIKIDDEKRAMLESLQQQ